MNRHTYTLKKPASWHNEAWREALPIGNGLSAALILGNIGKERIFFNRHDLWEDGSDPPIPDVTDTFMEMRRYIEMGDYDAANQNNLKTALLNKGYKGKFGYPEPLGYMTVDFQPEADFRKYRRGVNMRTGEAFVEFEIASCRYRRTAFVSRDGDVTVIRMTADRPFTAQYDFKLYKQAVECNASESGIRLVSENGYSGVHIRFVGHISSRVSGTGIRVTGNDYMILVRCSSHGSDLSIDHMLGQCYDELLKKHTALHTPLYDAVSIQLSDDEALVATNEQLLAEAYDDKASPALLERVWRFGRYLFISASNKDSLPIPLYGRWHGSDHLTWSQFVANENVEATYWHAMTGGLSYAIPPLIRYYTRNLDKFRECAKQIFGMRGIWICAYTTPGSLGIGEKVQLIANWISAAGWLSHHFWEYYVYTEDENLLREEILPFMYEAALFYRDYAIADGDKISLYPSVSPENTPSEILNCLSYSKGHVCRNATMDFAIMKELLTNLLCGISITGMYSEEAASFRDLLSKIPPYTVNEDGAVKEWMDPQILDNYHHRHLSHLYPVFPGTEITAHNNPALFAAFKKAVLLRNLGSQVGWSLAHMASIYARMGEAEKAVECLDIMEKSVTMDSLMTTANDWRDMGTTVYWHGYAFMQLDAAFGAVNAIQEMLFCWQKEALSVLPALPKRFESGSARGLVFPEGTIDISWETSGEVLIIIRAQRDINTAFLLCGEKQFQLNMSAGEEKSIKLHR